MSACASVSPQEFLSKSVSLGCARTSPQWNSLCLQKKPVPFLLHHYTSLYITHLFPFPSLHIILLSLQIIFLFILYSCLLFMSILRWRFAKAIDEAQLAARREEQHRQREAPRRTHREALPFRILNLNIFQDRSFWSCTYSLRFILFAFCFSFHEFFWILQLWVFWIRRSLQSLGCTLLEWILTMCRRRKLGDETRKTSRKVEICWLS